MHICSMNGYRLRVSDMLARAVIPVPDGAPSSSTEVELTVVSTPTRRPAAHLTPEDIEAIGAELDAIRERIIEKVGVSATRRTSAG